MAHELEARARDKGVLTIGEALEVVAIIIGDKPVDESDAAAIQAAEMRATGATAPPVSGVGLKAQAVAMANARRIYDEDRTTLAEVIGDSYKSNAEELTLVLLQIDKIIPLHFSKILYFFCSNFGHLVPFPLVANFYLQSDYFILTFSCANSCHKMIIYPY